jgi:hypothetical protein
LIAIIQLVGLGHVEGPLGARIKNPLWDMDDRLPPAFVNAVGN